MNKRDGFGHEKPHEGETNDWITPKPIIDAFNSLYGGRMFFALDPASSLTQPWPTSERAYTVQHDGLAQNWQGRVWLNPPYGPHTSKWVRRLAEHGNGIALIFARTETELWQDYIFPTADGFLFAKRRIAFARPDGSIGSQTAGAPSAFIAWGRENKEALMQL
ncbi:MAG TPA: DNA N-6-adenine-methyltransferase, partial [Geobacteraceae bacterium]